MLKAHSHIPPPTDVEYIEEREVFFTETGEKRERYQKRYIKGKILGKGGFAHCFEATSVASGNIYAAKVVDKKSLAKPNTKQKLISEIKIHKSLSHKNIVRFIKYFEDQKNVYILMELCNCKSLSDLMRRKKRLTEVEARFFMHQIFQAVAHLHRNRIIHRDLKLANLFLNSELEIKTGDFGLAAQLDYDGQRKQTICGTPNYLAPEILRKLGHSFEVDIWSCGVILYTMLCGVPPFETADISSTYRKIKSNLYKFPSTIALSDTVKNFIKRMLQSEPSKRPSAEEALMDEFFTSKEFCPVSPLVCPESLFDVATELSGSTVLKRRKLLASKNIQSVTDLAKKPTSTTAIPSTRLPLKPLNTNVVHNNRNVVESLVTARRTAITTTTAAPPTKVPLRSTAMLPPGLERPSSRLSNRNPSFPEVAKKKLEDEPVIKKPEETLYQNYLPLQNPADMSDANHSLVDDEEKASDKMEDDMVDDEKNLTAMHEKIEESFMNREGAKKLDTVAAVEPTFVLRVADFMDFSSDYGLAYRLNNGLTGAFFNDYTKIVYNPEAINVDYVLAKKDREGYYDQVLGFNNITKNYSKDFTKKILLIKYFKNQLENKNGLLPLVHDKLVDESRPTPSSSPLYYEGVHRVDTPNNYPYVKRWLKTNNCTVFRLTDGTVQVVFTDRTEIILAREARFVTYIDKAKNIFTKSIDDPTVHSMPEVAKRLEYTNEIVQQMIPRRS